MKKQTQKKPAPTVAKEGKANTIVLKNDDLATFIAWLNIPLHSEKAIARNRIVELLKKEANNFNSDRLAMLEPFKELDADKKPIMVIDESDNKEHFKLNDNAGWKATWEALLKKEVIFDVLPSNRTNWRIVRDIIANTKNEMDIETTEWYEGVLTALSKI